MDGILLNRWDINRPNSINSKNKITDNEIYILIEVDKEDINKKIYFLNDTDYYLEELKKSNTQLYINKYKETFKKYFIPKKEGEYDIYLEYNVNLTD